MALPETKQGLLLERDGWESIINSPDWVTYRRFLSEHLVYMQKQVNDALRKKEFTEAYGLLIAMDDAKKILDLVTIRLSDLNKAIEKQKE